MEASKGGNLMGKILAFTASGRENGISTKLVHLTAKAAEAQGHTVEYISLTAPQLQCCKGCGYCRSNDGCTINDGFFEKIVDCDGIIVGFPIYFSGVAGQGKAFLDRLYPMMDANFIPRHPGKKVIAVYAQGDPREQAFAPAINSANYVFRMCGWKLIDSILCAGTSSPDFIISDNLINRAKAAAEKL